LVIPPNARASKRTVDYDAGGLCGQRGRTSALCCLDPISPPPSVYAVLGLASSAFTPTDFIGPQDRETSGFCFRSACAVFAVMKHRRALLTPTRLYLSRVLRAIHETRRSRYLPLTCGVGGAGRFHRHIPRVLTKAISACSSLRASSGGCRSSNAGRAGGIAELERCAPSMRHRHGRPSCSLLPSSITDILTQGRRERVLLGEVIPAGVNIAIHIYPVISICGMWAINSPFVNPDLPARIRPLLSLIRAAVGRRFPGRNRGGDFQLVLRPAFLETAGLCGAVVTIEARLRHTARPSRASCSRRWRQDRST